MSPSLTSALILHTQWYSAVQRSSRHLSCSLCEGQHLLLLFLACLYWEPCIQPSPKIVTSMVVYCCICSQNFSSSWFFHKPWICLPAHKVDLFYSSCRLSLSFTWAQMTLPSEIWSTSRVTTKLWGQRWRAGSVKCAVRTLFCQHNISFIYNKICKL